MHCEILFYFYFFIGIFIHPLPYAIKLMFADT